MPDPEHLRVDRILYRFGPWEVHSWEETLLKDGERIRIQRLPFQMLLALLEGAGSVVTRDALQQRLWSDKTHVEFDNGLHVAATKLRQALGEDSAAPRFVKTVARQGYRFIAPVEAIPLQTASQAEASLALEPVVERGVVPGSSAAAVFVLASPQIVSRSRKRTTAIAIGLSALALIAGIVALLLFPGSWHAYHYRQQKIYLGSFANATGQTELDGMLTVVFQESLRESPFLRFLDPAKSVTDGPSLGLCRAAGAQLLIDGEIVSRSPGFNVSVSLWNCRSSKRLLTAESYAARPIDSIHALQVAANALRSRMGEPVPMLHRFSSANGQATTGSLAALRAFSLGDAMRDKGQTDEAVMYYKTAIDLDPNFALAYARLGAISSNRADFDARLTYYTAAYRLRDRTTERERLYILGHYYSEVTGDLTQSIATYKLWAGLYPYDPVPKNNLSNAYATLGEGSDALTAARAAFQLDPDNEVVYATLARALLAAGDTAQMAEICRGPMSRNNDISSFHNACFLFAFEQGDAARMQAEIQSARTALGYESMLNDEAWIAASQGRMQQAHQLSLAATKQNLQTSCTEEAALVQVDAALIDADTGSPQRARQAVASALQTDQSSGLVRGFAALAAARAGDTAQARQLTQEASQRLPLDTLINAALLPAVRVAIQLDESRPEQAGPKQASLKQADLNHPVRSLQALQPDQFSPDLSLAPTYYRGLALERTGQTAQANAAFQQVLQHRSIFPASLYLPLAELELAHNLQSAGDQAGAAQLFGRLQTLWQHADPRFTPLLRLRSYQKSGPPGP